jgi:hypothetical protein
MLKNNTRTRRRMRAGRFFDDPASNPSCLGCTACSEQTICGGLHVRSAAFDCLSYCCNEPSKCDNVCVRNPGAFVDRVREIEGFSLDTVPGTGVLSRPMGSGVIPMIYHGSSRAEGLVADRVALPLFQLLKRLEGTVKFASRSDLLKQYNIADPTKIILSGTDRDAPLERWWRYGTLRRMLILEHLSDLGVEVITSPNYSLFSDAPRWTDMHSMKRIAITWQEIASAGIRSALHVNARTLKDWRRWRDFIGERDEINCLAFEFATGASDPTRMRWHVDQLCALAHEVQRPLTLFVRGGRAVLPELVEAFTDVSLIDTCPFMRAVNRQEAVLRADGSVRWRRAANPDREVGNLLDHNVRALAAER